jgi:hypothetical protein
MARSRARFMTNFKLNQVPEINSLNSLKSPRLLLSHTAINKGKENYQPTDNNTLHVTVLLQFSAARQKEKQHFQHSLPLARSHTVRCFLFARSTEVKVCFSSWTHTSDLF